MKLTDKALIQFVEFLYKKYNYSIFEFREQEIIKNALIIEWFDSVGIYIEIGGSEYRGVEFWYNIQQFNSINGHNGHYFNTRNEAINEAILKANEIYNNL